ncbi:MAG: YbaK/EbsC family protein [Mogibacterium sp.]|nr:YbaK/EbsC family protein [Mogibacterium sp.]
MSIEKVREYFRQYGIEDRILEFDVSSATVDLAAEAVGVEGARICKTISLKTKDGCNIIQMAGDARVDNKKYKALFHEKAKFLTPEEVIEYTGHPIGGVCAFGIEREDVRVYCDVSLQRFETVFPACGTGNSAIELTCDEIFRYSKALDWIDVTKLPEEQPAP